MNDSIRADLYEPRFVLVASPHAALCDACGDFGLYMLYRFGQLGQLHVCSEECAADLSRAIRTKRSLKYDHAAMLRARRRDVVTVFRAAGLV